MYRLNQVKLNIYHSDYDFKSKIAKLVKVGVADIDWSTLIILHKSIDARDKKNILFVYNVAFDFVGARTGEHCEPAVGADIIRPLKRYEPVSFNPIVGAKHCEPTVGTDTIRPQSVRASSTSPNTIRPLVVGFGPAGIFASYIFALNGLRPIIVERGKSLEERTKDVEKFFDTMELDEESNVCFGEGGAGAFSDGKLNTNNKDKTGIYHFILETFVKFGADERILYENMPHIGTDKLVDVIKNIRDEIIKLGGEIHYNTKWKCTGSQDTPIVLAIGNSSRDTFRDLIENGFDLKPKAFAIGYRVAHRQSMIDEAQYGGARKTRPYEGSASIRPYEDKLGPATYKLTYDVGNGHSVYSFCMCPGGYIINSSNYKGMLSINGMSYNDRSGKYANSAIVETVTPEDILGSQASPLQATTECRPLQRQALKMIEFQEMIERRAFELEKGFIPYVTSEGSDICPEEVFKGQAKYSEKLKTVFDDLGLKFNINEDIEKALKHFNKIIPGFFSGSQASPIQTTLPFLIAGVETRTSSPVKLDRDENYMCNVPNYYPCGEGLGHGGGIISCAADGINVAMKICEKTLKLG
ncbi:MAG: FAD-dependent oxidoreductase [Lachnospiraceae bacterium]|nr:FAD-dependent oxidoreductase [Lachnospiraceae bacterium]